MHIQEAVLTLSSCGIIFHPKMQVCHSSYNMEDAEAVLWLTLKLVSQSVSTATTLEFLWEKWKTKVRSFKDHKMESY